MFDVLRVEYIVGSQGDRNTEGSIDIRCIWGDLHRVRHVSADGSTFPS